MDTRYMWASYIYGNRDGYSLMRKPSPQDIIDFINDIISISLGSVHNVCVWKESSEKWLCYLEDHYNEFLDLLNFKRVIL